MYLSNLSLSLHPFNVLKRGEFKRLWKILIYKALFCNGFGHPLLSRMDNCYRRISKTWIMRPRWYIVLRMHLDWQQMKQTLLCHVSSVNSSVSSRGLSLLESLKARYIGCFLFLSSIHCFKKNQLSLPEWEMMDELSHCSTNRWQIQERAGGLL